ncbi:MAG: amino acid ABC transporter permease [Micromonosporaceae bacterium]
MTSAPTTSPATERARPEPIRAVPVRRPWRWVAVGVMAVFVAMFVHMLLTNDAFNWAYMVDNMFRPPIMTGLRGTLILTVGAMVLGVALGVVIAIMRLSGNPILVAAAWTYTWVFRAVPRLVLAFLFGSLTTLWLRVEFGLPFDRQLGALFGREDFELRLFGFDTREVSLFAGGLVVGIIALGLSEAAYMAEIVRAGIQSVDPGQSEAAGALGMTRMQTLRRIVLPQAMRVIIPPTGNETIAMLKDTSLVAFVPITAELFYQLTLVGKREFQPFPMLVAATLWYLLLTSILLVAQYFVERHFSRGYGARRRSGGSDASTTARARLRLRGLAAEQGGAGSPGAWGADPGKPGPAGGGSR